MRMKAVLFLAPLVLAGCMDDDGGRPGPRGVHYECSPPRSLNVTFHRHGAAVRVDGAKAIRLREVPSVGGSKAYEGSGYALRITGNRAVWTGRTREAPYECREVGLPR